MMVLPAQEGRRVEREGLKGRGEPMLEREVLEKIGEVMAKKGIEMTGKRRREVVRNLRGDEVVRWGVGVVDKREKTVLEGEDGEEDDDEDEDEDDGDEWEEEEEEINEEDKERPAVFDDNRPSTAKRPTL